MRIHILTPDRWAEISSVTHELIFGTKKPASWDRIDFAVIAEKDDQTPIGYATAREVNISAVYLQFGGIMPEHQKSILAFKAYKMLIENLRNAYDEVFTYIDSTNKAMLRMAQKIGFKIIGSRTYNGNILLDHHLNFKET